MLYTDMTCSRCGIGNMKLIAGYINEKTFEGRRTVLKCDSCGYIIFANKDFDIPCGTCGRTMTGRVTNKDKPDYVRWVCKHCRNLVP